MWWRVRDYYDYIVGSYRRREKAEEMKRFFVSEEESKRNNSRKCSEWSFTRTIWKQYRADCYRVYSIL